MLHDVILKLKTEVVWQYHRAERGSVMLSWSVNGDVVWGYVIN